MWLGWMPAGSHWPTHGPEKTRQPGPRQDFYTACAREMKSRLSRAASRNCKKICNKFKF